MAKINQFGLLEMTRERTRMGISESQTNTCPQCNGYGVIRSYHNMTVYILKTIERLGIKERTPAIIKLHVSPVVGEFLLNQKREILVELERRHDIQIHIVYDIHMDLSHYHTEVQRLKNY